MLSIYKACLFVRVFRYICAEIRVIRERTQMAGAGTDFSASPRLWKQSLKMPVGSVFFDLISSTVSEEAHFPAKCHERPERVRRF